MRRARLVVACGIFVAATPIAWSSRAGADVTPPGRVEKRAPDANPGREMREGERGRLAAPTPTPPPPPCPGVAPRPQPPRERATTLPVAPVTPLPRKARTP